MGGRLDKGSRKIAINRCKKFLKDGMTQREIAQKLKISLQTVNKYCQEIAKEIEHKQKLELALIERKKRRASKVEVVRAEVVEPPVTLTKEMFEAKEVEMKYSAMCLFSEYLSELKERMPEMSIEELQKGLVEMWEKVNG